MRFGLVGPAYRSQSVNADCQNLINLYLEMIESGQGKAQAALYCTPGLKSPLWQSRSWGSRHHHRTRANVLCSGNELLGTPRAECKPEQDFARAGGLGWPAGLDGFGADSSPHCQRRKSLLLPDDLGNNLERDWRAPMINLELAVYSHNCAGTVCATH